MGHLNKLSSISNRFDHVIGRDIDKNFFIESLNKLSQTFERFYQHAIVFYIRLQFQSVVRHVEPDLLIPVLNSITDICLHDNEVKRIVIQVNYKLTFGYYIVKFCSGLVPIQEIKPSW
jgi:hypothetical protein